LNFLKKIRKNSIRLIQFWERNNIFIECQHGFHTGRSTNTALNKYKILDNWEACVGLFLDLTKAFDIVNHDILLQRLEFYGIRGVAYQYEQSDEKIITYGVPQGSTLGSLLFLIFINDLDVSVIDVKGVNLTLFADDTSILVNGNDLQDLAFNIDISLKNIFPSLIIVGC
jgi:retron-type reverse transcriptase